MADRPPFLPDRAADPFPAGTTGDFLLPICMRAPSLLMGEDLAVIVFTTVEDQRVGVPLAIDALSAVYTAPGEALLRMQAPEAGTVQ